MTVDSREQLLHDDGADGTDGSYDLHDTDGIYYLHDTTTPTASSTPTAPSTTPKPTTTIDF